MALIRCPECSKMVSQYAEICTNCGYPLIDYVKSLIECPMCKTLLPKHQNICTECGYDIVNKLDRYERAKKETEERLQREHDELVKTGKIKQFPLYGRTAEIHDKSIQQLKNYMNIVRIEERECIVEKELNALIDKRKHIFETEYTKKRINSLESYFSYMSEFLEKSLKNIHHVIISGFEPVKQLTEQEIYDIYSGYEDRLRLLQIHQAMYEIFKELEKGCTADEVIGELKKITRGRVVGGGFGLKGMLQGMAVAGVANAAIGGLYDLRNAWVKDKNSRKKMQRIVEWLNSKEFIDELKQALDNDLRLFVLVSKSIENMLIQQKEESVGGIIDFSEEEKHLNNEKRKVLNGTKEEKIDFIIYALYDYPTWRDIYSFAIEEIGDSRRELDEIGKCVGINNIQSIKRDFLDRKSKEICAKTFDYGEKYKEQLVECSEKIGIDLSLPDNINLIDAYVNKRNYWYIERITKAVRMNDIKNLENAVSKLQEMQVQEADEKIKEYEIIIQQLKEVEKIQKYVEKAEYSSVDALNKIIKDVEKMNAPKVAIDIYNKLLSQKAQMVQEKLELQENGDFIGDLDIAKSLKNDEERICNIYFKLNEKSDKQYDRAISELQEFGESEYDISKEIGQLEDEKERSARLRRRILTLEKQEKESEMELKKIPKDEELAGYGVIDNSIINERNFKREVNEICLKEKYLSYGVMIAMIVFMTLGVSLIVAAFVQTEIIFILGIILFWIIVAKLYIFYAELSDGIVDMVKEYEQSIVSKRENLKKILDNIKDRKMELEMEEEKIEGKKLEPVLKIREEVGEKVGVVKYDGYAILSISQFDARYMYIYTQQNMPQKGEEAFLYCYDEDICQAVTYKKKVINGSEVCYIPEFVRKTYGSYSTIWILLKSKTENGNKVISDNVKKIKTSSMGMFIRNSKIKVGDKIAKGDTLGLIRTVTNASFDVLCAVEGTVLKYLEESEEFVEEGQTLFWVRTD